MFVVVVAVIFLPKPISFIVNVVISVAFLARPDDGEDIMVVAVVTSLVYFTAFVVVVFAIAVVVVVVANVATTIVVSVVAVVAFAFVVIFILLHLILVPSHSFDVGIVVTFSLNELIIKHTQENTGDTMQNRKCIPLTSTPYTECSDSCSEDAWKQPNDK